MYPLTLEPLAISSVWKFNNPLSFIHSSVLFSTPYGIAMLVMSIKILIQDNQNVYGYFIMCRGGGGWGGAAKRKVVGVPEGGSHHSFL